ncbi:DNA cytosine methyltransferase [Helicobacter pylori]|nr:DNA cytosine methyltransferase [Helicobacter pylori]
MLFNQTLTYISLFSGAGVGCYGLLEERFECVATNLHRSITPREAARIQSFSNNYIFYGNKTSVCKQIGNAVPPLLALALGKAILKSSKNDTNPSR